MSNNCDSYISIQESPNGMFGNENISVVPIINQEQRKPKIIDCDENSNAWIECLKKTLINFIWIYVVGIIAFYITMLSVSARGSYLRDHLTISMVLIFAISLTCSFALSISMIYCGQICKKLIPSPEDENECIVAENIHQEDREIDEPFLLDNGQQNILRSFSANQMPTFHEIAAIR